MTPTVVVSLDCEGRWGMVDSDAAWIRAIDSKSLAWAYDRLLSALAERSIPASFALVSLFASEEDQIVEALRELQDTNTHRGWCGRALERILEDRFDGWVLSKVVDRIRSDGIHEIASHSFTHLPLSLVSDPALALDLELRGVREWAETLGIDPQTYIFPRNEVFPMNQGHGSWLGYRESGPETNSIRRVLSEFNVRTRSQVVSSPTYPPIGIPSGTFMNWRHGVRAWVPAAVTVARWQRIMQDAVCRGDGVALLRLHPHNLITGKSQFDLLERLLDEIALRVRCGDLQVMTQRQLCLAVAGSIDSEPSEEVSDSK